MGYSYGGEMAAFVEGKTDRFKAVISGAPVIDQFSEYGNERTPGTTAGTSASRGSTMKTPGAKARLPAQPRPKRPSCSFRAKRHHRPAGPVRGDVSRPAPGRCARRTGHLSARRPRPAGHVASSATLARALARLTMPASTLWSFSTRPSAPALRRPNRASPKPSLHAVTRSRKPSAACARLPVVMRIRAPLAANSSALLRPPICPHFRAAKHRTAS